ncbi:zf-RVT domain-containing protein [Citrus sinensis]|uniref:Zf-RVT domain-containing protein n=1 Tax=Citrus sinensis TaxID=2711 RepID=A0ACB8IKM4_CITSI|nr:zf-RVT domain-containing protein [Citrus sinensis]
MGSNPSYIWRSIMWGRQVLLKGYRWRIGNGEDTSVFRSNWLPRPATFKPIFKPKLPADAKVAVLIDNENKWKACLIQKIFSKEDAETILNIPLPRSKRKDQVIWHYDKKGEYFVKSGYQVALSMKFLNSPGCLSSNSSNWSIIWKLPLPEKIKIFIWKATKNLLPTAENLCKHGIIQEGHYKRCGNRVENVLHALVACKAAKKFGSSLLWLMQ